MASNRSPRLLARHKPASKIIIYPRPAENLKALDRYRMNGLSDMMRYNYEHREEIAAKRLATQPRRDAAYAYCRAADLAVLKKEFMEHKTLQTEVTMEATAILAQVLQDRLSPEAWHLISQEKTAANHERHRALCEQEWSVQSIEQLLQIVRYPSWQARDFKDTFKAVLRAKLTPDEWNIVASWGHTLMR